MRLGKKKGAIKFRRIHDRVSRLSAKVNASFFDILRGNKNEADKYANQGARNDIGLATLKDHEKHYFYVP